jgi:predicted RNase H-like HicB family nuclease
MRKAVSLARLARITSVGVLATVFLSLDVRADEAQYDLCAKALSAECLADLATEAGLAGKPPSSFSNGMIVLWMMDREEAAKALIVRGQVQRGKTLEEAEQTAEARFAAPRLARAVRDGMTPEEAYATVPRVDHGSAYIAALELLGRRPYGKGLGPTVPTEADLVAVAGIAELLVGLAGGLDWKQKETALEYGAELFALLGDRDRATEIFLGIERVHGWRGYIPSDLLSPTIGAAALELCKGQAECRVQVVHRAATVAGTPAEAEAMLREAFGFHQFQEPWPDFDKMDQVVGLAIDRGDSALALELARTLDGLSKTRKGVYPIFPHIFAARALLLAGAPVEDVNAALDRAESEMLVGSDEIRSQALLEQSRLRALLGEVDWAVRLLEGIEDPTSAWGYVLGPDLPLPTIDTLTSAAANVLTGQELLELRANTAARMLQPEASPAHRDWALRTGREVMAEVDPSDESALHTCYDVVRVAEDTEEDSLLQAGLNCIGQAALRSRDASKMLEAATLWFAYASAAP